MTTSNHKTYKVRRYFSFIILGDPLGGFLEAVLGPLEGVLEASKRPFGGLWGPLGGIRGASGRLLGAIWEHLGYCVAQEAPKMSRRRSQDSPKPAPRGPKRLPRAPKRGPRGPYQAQKAIKTNPKLHATYKAQKPQT